MHTLSKKLLYVCINIALALWPSSHSLWKQISLLATYKFLPSSDLINMINDKMLWGKKTSCKKKILSFSPWEWINKENQKGKRWVQLSGDSCPWEILIFQKCHSVLGIMETPPGNASPDWQDRIALLMDIITTTRVQLPWWDYRAKKVGEEQDSQNIQ